MTIPSRSEAYATREELITWMRVTPDSKLTTDEIHARESDFERVLKTASDNIDNGCGRRFDSQTGARTFRLSPYSRFLRCGDVSDVTLVRYRQSFCEWETLTEDTHYYVMPPYITGQPSRVIKFNTLYSFTPHTEVEVTATWGWPAVPATIKQATLMWAERLINSNRFLDRNPMPDVMRMCDDYKVVKIAI